MANLLKQSTEQKSSFISVAILSKRGKKLINFPISIFDSRSTEAARLLPQGLASMEKGEVKAESIGLHFVV